ncbi:hypothetical protein ACJ41O_005116 [Fusarium nematophilum]
MHALCPSTGQTCLPSERLQTLNTLRTEVQDVDTQQSTMQWQVNNMPSHMENETQSKQARSPTAKAPEQSQRSPNTRKDAPERYLEHDIYYAHERDLPRAGQGVLPESDLLKAIHGYTSAFYAARHRGHHPSDSRGAAERSMDETALLAFGILLEEAGKEVLGRRGDLVFTEGEDDAPVAGGGGEEVAPDDARLVGRHDIALRRGPKRRKVVDE